VGRSERNDSSKCDHRRLLQRLSARPDRSPGDRTMKSIGIVGCENIPNAIFETLNGNTFPIRVQFHVFSHSLPTEVICCVWSDTETIRGDAGESVSLSR
jgi:hypothetical protein